MISLWISNQNKNVDCHIEKENLFSWNLLKINQNKIFIVNKNISMSDTGYRFKNEIDSRVLHVKNAIYVIINNIVNFLQRKK